jgi:hypothetical protein
VTRIDPQEEAHTVEAILAELRNGRQTPAAQLIEEHLEGAHAYVLAGAWPEYELNLDLAREAAAHEHDPAERHRLERLLAALSFRTP